jgi:hypothetical protein
MKKVYTKPSFRELSKAEAELLLGKPIHKVVGQ